MIHGDAFGIVDLLVNSKTVDGFPAQTRYADKLFVMIADDSIARKSWFSEYKIDLFCFVFMSIIKKLFC